MWQNGANKIISHYKMKRERDIFYTKGYMTRFQNQASQITLLSQKDYCLASLKGGSNQHAYK